MTIAAGFAVRDGILLCADSQYSGWEKVYKPKLFHQPFGRFSVCFAMSGDAGYGRMIIDECFDALSTLSPEQATTGGVRRVIREHAKAVVDEYSQRGWLEQSQKPEFLVAISHLSSSIGYLFASHDSSLARVDRFAFCGSGSYIGQYVMRTFHPAIPEFMTMGQAAFIAHCVLAAAKRHDSSCGGGSQFLVIKGMEATTTRQMGDIDESDALIHRYELFSKQLLMATFERRLSQVEFDREIEIFADSLREMRAKVHAAGSAYQPILNLADEE